MRFLILLLAFCLFSCSNQHKQAPDQLRAQAKELPVTSLEDASFNRDSIEQLLELIKTTSRKDFREDWL